MTERHAMAYPLQWPAGWKRSGQQRNSPFGNHSVARATDRILAELGRKPIGCSAHDVVISTNVELRMDGLPRSNRRPPEDSGVAVYFRYAGRGHGAGLRSLAPRGRQPLGDREARRGDARP